MMKRALCSLLSFALVGVQFCSPVLAASDSHLKEAEQAFSEKRFHAAEDLLTAAITKNPTDQAAHLLLARTYVQLLDNKAAEYEYTNCIKCNPFSSIGRMAHQETINIGGRSAADKARPSDDVKTVSKSVDEINREANDLKTGYGSTSRTMTSNYSQQTGGASLALDRASNAAARAANRAARKAARMGALNGQPGLQAYGQSGVTPNPAQPRLPSTLGQPGTSSAFAQRGMPNSYTQPGVSYASSVVPSAVTQPAVPTYGQQNAAQTAAQARMAAHKARMDSLRAALLSQTQSRAGSISPNDNANRRPGKDYAASDYQVQKMHKQQEDAQHAQYTQDSANNLQRLMSEKQNPNSPKLRALGTNLFVRYYGSHDQDGSTASAPGADPVIEMKAKQMKLGDTK